MVIYLTGVTNDAIQDHLAAAGVGLMIQPGNSYHLRIGSYPYWAADNGCFNSRWTEDRWIDWLSRTAPDERCLFAVAPDVYPTSRESLDRGLSFVPLMREMGFPVAIVAQGSEPIRYPWEDFDCLFIGGQAQPHHPKSEWKVSAEAEQLVHEARRAGKWVHMGRVNSLWRIERAREMGCHSVDGTFLKWRRRRRASDTGDERLGRGGRELARWLWLLDHQPVLWQWETPSHPNHRRAS